MKAFINKQDTKDWVLSQLDKFHSNGNLVRKPLFWDGEKGSPVTVSTLSSDIDSWETKLSLPRWLALFIDGVYTNSPNDDAGLTAVKEIISAIKVGEDYSAIGYQYIGQVLLTDALSLVALTDDLALKEIIQQLAQLHEKETSLTVSNKDWRMIRNKAVNITNGFDLKTVNLQVGQCAEASAWSITNSDTLLYDVARSWSNAVLTKKLNDSGWDQHSDVLVKSTLDQLYNEAKNKASDDSSIDVFALLEEKKPEIATKLQNKIKMEKEFAISQWEHNWQLMLSNVQNK